jgi:hypothetical protein
MTTRYALLLNPIARGLEELRPEGFMNETSCAIILRTALVASTVCIAFVLPFFGKHAAVFQIVNTSLSLLLFILKIFSILYQVNVYILLTSTVQAWFCFLMHILIFIQLKQLQALY